MQNRSFEFYKPRHISAALQQSILENHPSVRNSVRNPSHPSYYLGNLVGKARDMAIAQAGEFWIRYLHPFDTRQVVHDKPQVAAILDELRALHLRGRLRGLAGYGLPPLNDQILLGTEDILFTQEKYQDLSYRIRSHHFPFHSIQAKED